MEAEKLEIALKEIKSALTAAKMVVGAAVAQAGTNAEVREQRTKVYMKVQNALRTLKEIAPNV